MLKTKKLNNEIYLLYKKHFETNHEFKQAIIEFQSAFPNRWEEKLQQKVEMLKQYFISYDLMSEQNCRQKIVGYRYIIKFDNGNLFFKITKCPHFRQLFLNVLKYYSYNDFPKKFLNKRFNDYQDLQSELEISLLWSHFDQLLSNTAKALNLFIHGPSGTGKTLFSVLFCNAYIKKMQKKVAFINARTIVFNIKDCWNQKKGLQTFLRQLASVDLLVIDDLGFENNNAIIRDEFMINLLKTRKNYDLKTIFISKLSQKEFEKIYIYNNSKIEMQKAYEFYNLIFHKSAIYNLKVKLIEKW